MKNLLIIAALLVAVSAFADSPGGGVAVHLGPVSVIGTHTNLWFDCNVTIINQTELPLTVTNLFGTSPGLALKVKDSDGKELKRLYAWPLKSWEWTHDP